MKNTYGSINRAYMVYFSILIWDKVVALLTEYYVALILALSELKPLHNIAARKIFAHNDNG